ncbi:MAG: LCP family protein [Propionibacteriaceae bacterium]|nr:LCP family protein [Propionibacteriaceae bacterium]
MSDSLFDDDGLRETESDKASRKGNRRALIVLLSLFLVIGLVVAGVIGWYLKAVNDGLSSIKRDPGLLPSVEAVEPTPSDDDTPPPMSILIIGSDSRGKDRGRSDALMVMHVPSNRKSVNLISIPRDSWVPIEGHGTSKINAAYSWGGAPLAVTTVQNLLGIHIDHVAITDFEGFKKAIDAVGGVDVYNKQESSNNGYNWPAGHITLATGEEARWYVGQRYGLKGGDFDRNERQRDVTIAVMKKLASAGVVTNPVKFRDAVLAVGPSFTVDEGLTNDLIMQVGREVGLDGAKNLRSMMAPTAGYGKSSGGAAYVRLDADGVKALGKALHDDTFDAYWKSR